MSTSEHERQLTTRVSNLEEELGSTRRLYFQLRTEKDDLLEIKNKEIARLHGVVARLKGEVSIEGAEVARLRGEVERLTPNVTGPSSKKKAEMMLARLNRNV